MTVMLQGGEADGRFVDIPDRIVRYGLYLVPRRQTEGAAYAPSISAMVSAAHVDHLEYVPSGLEHYWLTSNGVGCVSIWKLRG